jgi:hypothetical protein
MKIEPLSKAIHEKALSLGVTSIELQFSGGSDEAYLNVILSGGKDTQKFEQEVEEWAYCAYNYGGAGDGNDYGDNITYDLINKKATAEEWMMERTTGDSSEDDLEISEE